MTSGFSRVLIVLAASLGLGGCFQPLHGGALSGSAATVAQIEVAPITGHLGHQLKSELDFVLSNGAPPTSPQYRLSINHSTGAGNVIADSAGGRPQVLSYSASANFHLVSLKDGTSIVAGTTTATASIDRTLQRFSSLRALRDVEIRAARTLAEQIRSRIVLALLAPKT